MRVVSRTSSKRIFELERNVPEAEEYYRDRDGEAHGRDEPPQAVEEVHEHRKLPVVLMHVFHAAVSECQATVGMKRKTLILERCRSSPRIRALPLNDDSEAKTSLSSLQAFERRELFPVCQELLIKNEALKFPVSLQLENSALSP